MIDAKTLNILEYRRITDRLAEFCVNEGAAGRCRTLEPVTEFEACQDLLDWTAEADRILYLYAADPVCSFDEIGPVLEKAHVLSTLSIPEIMRSARLLRAARIFSATLQPLPDEGLEKFKSFAGALYEDLFFEKETERCFLTEEQVADQATNELFSIRKKIRKCNEDIKNTLLNMSRSKDFSAFLQDSLVTLRNGRYVLPVKQEHRSAVPGLIHDQSATGATVFIEPMAVVEANNELRTLYAEEQAEIERILKHFTAKVCGMYEALKTDAEILTVCDVHLAKAKYAHSVKGQPPKLNSSGFIDIKGGRHPLIDPQKVVPVSVSLGQNYRMLVITGPNTGGKTVTLKLTGLFCLMAMSGMFLPCLEGTEISVFSKIFCDIGDEQSIEQSLSTFSSHIKNIAYIADHVDRDTLVLMDEIGAGTDPEEGSALAMAVLEALLESGCKGILTTHYGGLKEFSMVTEGVENASMAFDPVDFAPTYRLNIGMPGSSNALEIANRLHLDPRIIQRARGYLKQEKVDLERVLQRAEESRFQAQTIVEEVSREKAELEQKLAEVEAEREKLAREREKLTQNAKMESRRIIHETVYEAEEIVGKLKDLLNEELSEQTLFTARQLKKKLENLSYKNQAEEESFFEEPKPLTRDKLFRNRQVYVRSLKAVATLVDFNERKNEYRVRLGNLTTVVRFEDLCEVKKQPAPKKESRPEVYLKRGGPAAVASEIKLLGKTVAEALPEVEAFLDQAYLSGLHEVKIIHGTGTGALRKAVQDDLRRNPCVQEFRDGVYGEGERGVTIVTLKEK